MGDEIIDAVVGEENDLHDNEMKEVTVNDVKVLLTRVNGKYHATGSKCSHYGAPLINGSFCGGIVRCPWHGACFDVASGDIEDFPGLDSIPKYDVEVIGGKIHVKAKRSVLEKSKRVKTMLTTAPSSKATVLIIGGGPSAMVCAETLRQEGYQGRIVITAKEGHLPYDRPKLSKAPSSKAEDITLRDKAFFDTHHIEIKLNKEATAVDMTKKTVTFKDGDTMGYDKLVLATGTTARTLSALPGNHLENITTLRTVDDANLIASHAAGKDVVIFGTSFIGMEVASALAGKAKTITVADMVETPFQRALGKEIGSALKKILEEKGVQFHFQTTVKEFVGDGSKLKAVILKDGTSLPADLCVLGIGVLPATDFLKSSGIKMSEHGFIVVNKHMETSHKDVYAVGDIAQFPLFIVDNEPANIQHWQMAHQHGRICALNIAGKKTDIHSVPFFWTVLCGKSLRYTGYGFGYDDIVIHGNPSELKFVAFYTKGDRVIAVASLNMDPVVAQAAQMMFHEMWITKTEIQSDPMAWTKKLKTHTCSTHM